MARLLASLYKECLLVLRDWHALLLLFAMPSLFVLIMSLALQSRFDSEAGVQLQGWLVNHAGSANAQRLQQELLDYPLLDLAVVAEAPPLSTAERLFSVTLETTFDDALAGRDGHVRGMALHFAPELGPRERFLVEAAVKEAFAYFNTTELAEEMGFDRDYARRELLREGFVAVVPGPGGAARPSAVQQSVSAWLIFAMFFIAIPISTTFIQERQQKTLLRLRTLGLPLWILYSAKLMPYLVVNLLQLALMLAMGALLLPVFGAEALSLDVHLGALLLMALSVSLGALGMACLIATAFRSVEQATVVTAGANIIFAALGGVMIPSFIMPSTLQTIGLISPMAWGLEGFLEVLVRGGGPGDIMAPAAVLATMGVLFWGFSIRLLDRGYRHG